MAHGASDNGDLEMHEGGVVKKPSTEREVAGRGPDCSGGDAASSHIFGTLSQRLDSRASARSTHVPELAEGIQAYAVKQARILAVANADVELATIPFVPPFTPAESFAPMAEILAKPIIGQMAPMGTGGFDIVLDMLKDVIVDHRLLVQNMLAAHAGYGVATPGGLIPYNSSSPMYDEAFKGDAVAFSLLAQSGEDDPAGFTSYLLGFSQSPFRAGPDSALPRASPYSPSPPGNHSSTPPCTPASFGKPATSPFRTPPFATSPFFSQFCGAAILPTSPMLDLVSPANSHYTLTSPTFSPHPTSPQYSPTSPSFSPVSPRYSPTSPAQGSPMPPKYKSHPLRITQWILPHHYVEQICSPS
ncbi:hypothetical protein BS47DRAFT_1400466 [Hydnum rufescens UP504]|uniref:Uncharacterized protein n=1 Tax=Hydnum rufescens UP504 TaxID=1448309 RepID=A0A9P6AI94_9AGAM|nr:hypothetical protein BS47DRAFT_1400466 [Hydnum rufescens UP504]